VDRIRLLCWLVDPHFRRLTPAARVSAPARWIGTAGLLVDIVSLLADCAGSTVMMLMGRHEFDGAVTVSVVVPVHKGRHPLAGFVLVGKGPAGVVGPVFDRSEKGFRVRVVVGDPGPREGSEHLHLLQPRFQRRPTHGIAVVGMQDQWLLLALVAAKTAGSAVALPET